MKRFLFMLIVLLAASSLGLARDLPRRAFFGAQLSEPTPEQISESGLDVEGGVALAGIVPESSADAAGLQVGDILTKLNDEPLTLSGIRDAISSGMPGDRLDLEFVRGTEELSCRVILRERPREASEDFDVQYEAVDVDGHLRRIIFTKPHGEGPFPLVVLMGGLGCYSVDVPPPTPFEYRDVLYALTRAGFATLRVEKTGMGDSEGPPCSEQSFFDEVNGYLAALRDLARFSFVDRERVIYLGHSMGGLTAPVVYQDIPCAGICAIGTGGISWLEYELQNQRRQLVLAGTDFDSLEVQQQQKELALHLLFVAKQTPDQILEEHPELEEYLQYPAHYTFMQEVAGLNLASYWKHVDTPVLFIHGGADFVSDAYEHAYARDIVNFYHPGRAEYLEFPGMDHYLLTAEDEADAFANLVSGLPRREFNEEIMEPLLAFCRKASGM